jgi:argininosuccinate lyase
VQLAERKQVELDQLSLADLQSISPQFATGAQNVLTVANALARRTAVGGTAAHRLEEQLGAARRQQSIVSSEQ